MVIGSLHSWVPDQIPLHLMVGIHSCVASLGQIRPGRAYHSPGQTTADIFWFEGSPCSLICGHWLHQGTYHSSCWLHSRKSSTWGCCVINTPCTYWHQFPMQIHHANVWICLSLGIYIVFYWKVWWITENSAV